MSENLKVEIITTDALSAGDVGLWREMIAANPDLSSPYFRPEFTSIAGRVSPQSAVAVFKSGGRTIGFFPHQRRGGTVQPLAAPMNDYHGVVAAPGEAPDLATVDRLLGARRMTVSAWVGEAPGGVARDSMMAVMTGGTFDGWYAERRAAHGKYFKDKERARRSLEAEAGPVRVEIESNDPAMLDHLIGLKRGQYVRTGRHDIFACGWTRDLLHALMAGSTPEFGASMATLWAGDQLAACEFSLHAGDRYHFWFPAYEPALARCSPGILLSMETMRHAAPLGYRSFDYGFAGEGYKKYFCNGVQTVNDAVVTQPGVGTSLSQVAVGMLNRSGAGRGERLRTSVRHRWAAIEACETTTVDRLRGAAVAARAAVGKLSRVGASA